MTKLIAIAEIHTQDAKGKTLIVTPGQKYEEPDAEKAAKLLALGAAKKAKDAKEAEAVLKATTAPAPATPPEAEETDDADDADDADADEGDSADTNGEDDTDEPDLEAMTEDELIAYGKELGLKVKKSMTKKAIIKAIKEALAD